MAEPTTQKDLPQSIEAEVSVLGAVLLDPTVVDTVAPLLAPEAFSRPAHAEIYRAIVDLHDSRRGVDLVTVGEELKRRKKLDDVGGLEYLAQLVDSVPSAANAEHYARIVREKYVNRDLIRAATQILDTAYSGRHESAQLLDDAERLIFEIAERGTHRPVAELKTILLSTFEKIDRARNRGDRLTGLETGLHDLDDLTSGLQPSDFIVLAARPSVGKTSLALSLLERIGLGAKVPGVLFSLEMAQEQIARNMLCSHARINSHKLRTGILNQDELRRLGEAAGRLSEAPILIDDSPGISIFELRAKARRLKSQYKIGLIILDYLQLMDPPKADSREQQVAQLSRGLKAMARELEVPVIALAQLNRGVELRDDHRPRLADLRESGSIEQDADVVLLLHRPSMYARGDEAPPPSADGGEMAELIIAKQRNGPTGMVKLTFLKSFMRYENFSAPRGDL